MKYRIEEFKYKRMKTTEAEDTIWIKVHVRLMLRRADVILDNSEENTVYVLRKKWCQSRMIWCLDPYRTPGPAPYPSLGGDEPACLQTWWARLPWRGSCPECSLHWSQWFGPRPGCQEVCKGKQRQKLKISVCTSHARSSKEKKSKCEIFTTRIKL